jgi:hypothetical protein
MTKARSASQIINAIDCAHLSLHRGEGYWYFEYDDSDRRYETRSVMVMYLNSMDLTEWVAEGQALVDKMEGDSE